MLLYTSKSKMVIECLSVPIVIAQCHDNCRILLRNISVNVVVFARFLTINTSKQWPLLGLFVHVDI